MRTPNVIAVQLRDLGFPHSSAVQHRAISLTDAFWTHWQDDRFFTIYQRADVTEWYRYPKVGVDPADHGLTTCLSVLDLDAALALTDAQWARARDAIQSSPWACRWLYRTVHGVRLVYLHEPMSPLRTRAVVTALAREVSALDLPDGLKWDDRCTDWSRLFRLPYTQRNDEKFVGPTPRDPIVEGPTLDLSRLEVTEADAFLNINRTLSPVPDRQAIETLIRTPRGALTPWAKKALELIPRSNENRYIFTHPAISFDAPRTDSMLCLNGALVSRLMTNPAYPNKGAPGTTPEHIYALVLPTIDQSKPLETNGGRTLYQEGWKQITRLWAQDEAKQERARAEAALEAVEQAVEMIDARTRIAKVMAGYPNPLTIAPEDVHKFAVVSVGSALHVLQPDGYYSSCELQKGYLYSALRDVAHPFVDLGEDEDIKAQDILNRYHTPLRAARYKSGPGSVEAWTDGKQFYIAPYHRRKDIEPTCFPEIEDYLGILGGPDTKILERWFGLALAYDLAPLPALVILGETEIGKSLIAQGFKGTTNRGYIADGTVFEHFNYGWHEAFMAHIDEGWKPAAKVEGIPDKFRRYITGDVNSLNAKGAHPRHCEVYPRFLITANSDRIFDVILGDPTLTKEDDEAICSRIVCVTGQSQAAGFLKRLGRDHIDGKWVKESWLARHLLYLYETHGRHAKLAGRFLMPGRMDPKVLTSVRARAGDAPEVGTAICEMLKDPAQRAKLKHKENAHYQIKAADIQAYWRDRLAAPRLNVAQIGKGLKPFLVPQSRNNAQGGRHRLDLTGAVAEFAELYGYDVSIAVAEAKPNTTV